MKNRFFATLSSLALLTSAAAFAQSDAVMQANIPFEFHVGATILPPGRYEVRPQINPGVLSIRRRDCNASAMIVMHAVDARKTPEAATLVFNRYDDTYFLSRVWTPEYSQGRELPKSKAELEYARNSWPAQPAVVALVRR